MRERLHLEGDAPWGRLGAVSSDLGESRASPALKAPVAFEQRKSRAGRSGSGRTELEGYSPGDASGTRHGRISAEASSGERVLALPAERLPECVRLPPLGNLL